MGERKKIGHTGVGRGGKKERKKNISPLRPPPLHVFSSPQSFILNSFNIAPEIDNLPPSTEITFSRSVLTRPPTTQAIAFRKVALAILKLIS